MAQVPLFGLGLSGRSKTVSAQSHLNLYAQLDEEKGNISFHGTPGLILFSQINGDTPIRGWLTIGSLIYYVHREHFYQIDNALTRVDRGSLNSTSGRVDISYDGTVILIVDGINGYTYTVATETFAQITSPGFPNGAHTCGWLDSNFIVDAGGSDSFFISPDGLTWDALDVATAESAPDGLVRVFVDHGQVLLMGENTIEPWGSVGDFDFPYAPIKGGISESGLAARWSVTKFNDGLAFLGKNSRGQVQMMFMVGFVAKPISSPNWDHTVNAYAIVSDATAFSYMLGGHPMLQVNFPSAGKSWLYDAITGMWSALESGLSGGRHRGEMAVDFLNKVRVADYSNGNIYTLDPETYTDNGTVIPREFVTRHLYNGNVRVRIDELYLDVEVGVGLTTGQGSNPQIMLTVSKDQGKTWSAEMWKSIGAIGQYLTRVIWRRLGISRDWLFRCRVSDPVKVVFVFPSIESK